jgi:hypothetical protein
MFILARCPVWGIYITWTLATLIGGGLGNVLSFWILSLLLGPIFGLFFSLLLIGILVALSQEWVLRRCIPSLIPWQWSGLTSIGVVLGWLAVESTIQIGALMEFNHAGPAVVFETLGGGVLGLLMSGVQWSVLKGYSYNSIFGIKTSLIWILAGTLAWASGILIYRTFVRAYVVRGPLDDELKFVHSQGWMIALVPIAVITGLALMIVLRREEM